MTRGDARIGVIPMAFYDGLARDGFAHMPQNVAVLVCGKRAPVAGTICMDQAMVNLQSVPEAKIDDEVVVIGRQGDEEITVEEVAQRLNTIATQVLSLFSARVPRIFV